MCLACMKATYTRLTRDFTATLQQLWLYVHPDAMKDLVGFHSNRMKVFIIVTTRHGYRFLCD